MLLSCLSIFKSIHLERLTISSYRWDQPEFANGLITGYTVQCWFKENNVEIQICNQSLIPSTLLEHTVQDLLPNTTYYFQVRAHTEIGAGPYTDVTNVSTMYENPVPQLLVATMDAVRISDLDQEVNYTITRHIAVEVTYLAAESKIYWINEMQELVTSDLNGANATKILTLNNSAFSITVDWVARHLYWSESSYRENGGCIMKLDLTMWQAGILKYKNIVMTSRRIVNLDILPSTGYLFLQNHFSYIYLCNINKIYMKKIYFLNLFYNLI